MGKLDDLRFDSNADDLGQNRRRKKKGESRSARKIAQDPGEASPQPVAPQAPTNGATTGPPAEAFFAAKPPSPSSVVKDFDLNSFRASPAPLVTPVDGGVAAIRVRKPGKSDFIYVHPECRELIYIIPEDFKRRREAHLVLPAIAVAHPDICRKVLVVPYCSDAGDFYLWPIPQEDATGRINDFNKSAMQQIAKSIGHWSQFVANMGNQTYRLFYMNEQRDAPNWPPGGIEFFIVKAFEDRIITTKDHPLFRQLRGREVL